MIIFYRDLCYKEWKKGNKNKNKKKKDFKDHWKNLVPNEKKVHCKVFQSHLFLTDFTIMRYSLIRPRHSM